MRLDFPEWTSGGFVRTARERFVIVGRVVAGYLVRQGRWTSSTRPISQVEGGTPGRSGCDGHVERAADAGCPGSDAVDQARAQPSSDPSIARW